MQLLLEMSNEHGPSIRYDGVGHSMQTQNALNVQLCISLHIATGMNRKELGRLHESINNPPDGIILTGGERQTHNEIHVDVSSLPSKNIQWLQQSDKS
jgi:hypothetical protein